MKAFDVDKLHVKIYDSRQQMGEAAAAEAGAYLRQLLSSQEEVRVVFAAAPSSVLMADEADVKGFAAFLKRYKKYGKTVFHVHFSLRKINLFI